MKKPKSGCLKKVGITSIVFFTIIISILAILYGSTDLGSAASDYKKNRAAAEKAGLFFTQAQVTDHFNVPDADNGVDLMAKIDFKPIGPFDYFTDEEIRSKNSEIEMVVRGLEEVSLKKYLLSKKSDLISSFPESAKVRSGINLLCVMAKFSSGNADQAACRRYLQIAARLSNLADDTGEPIALLVRVACAQMIEARLRRIVPMHANDPAWLSVVEDTLKELDQPYDLRLELKLEHRVHIEYVKELKKGPMSFEQMRKNTDIPLSMRLSYYLPRYEEASLSRIHEYYSTLSLLVPNDPYDWNQLEKALQYDKAFQSRKGWSYEALMEPQFFGAQAIWKEISFRNALFQAVAILKTHEDPAKGLPLSGRYRLDMDGKPIRIKHLEKGWIIYSLFDGVDDGGVKVTLRKGDEVIHLSMATAPTEPKPLGSNDFKSRSGTPVVP